LSGVSAQIPGISRSGPKSHGITGGSSAATEARAKTIRNTQIATGEMIFIAGEGIANCWRREASGHSDRRATISAGNFLLDSCSY